MQEAELGDPSLLTALDRARHSWEGRQHVGRGGARLDVFWNMVGVRKDKLLLRLVELCIPEGFGQLLTYKWAFQSAFSDLKWWNEWVPARTMSTICALILWRWFQEETLVWCCWLLTRECCTFHWPAKCSKETSHGQSWTRQEIVHISSSLTLCHFPITCSYHGETSYYRPGILKIYLNIPNTCKYPNHLVASSWTLHVLLQRLLGWACLCPAVLYSHRHWVVSPALLTPPCLCKLALTLFPLSENVDILMSSPQSHPDTVLGTMWWHRSPH